MTIIVINPLANQVILDGDAVEGVSMTGVDPSIQTVQFNTYSNSGVVGFLKNASGKVPPAEQITSVASWQTQIDNATQIIYYRENPKTFYSKVDPVGKPVLSTAKGWPQPPNTTSKVPPTQPTPNTVLYWEDSEIVTNSGPVVETVSGFVWSAFPYAYTLDAAKSYIVNAINSSAYSLLLPSDWAVVRQYETEVEVPTEWSTWRQEIRDQAVAKTAAANACSSKEALNVYSQSETYFNWPVSPTTPLV